MTTSPSGRAVYDCNVLLQGFVNSNGPAGACIAAAIDERVSLSCSRFVLDELREVASRPSVRAKFPHITDERLSDFIDLIAVIAQFPDDIPQVYAGCRDPDDNHYIDLALATSSVFVVSRDKDLLVLRNPASLQGRELAERFPQLRIVEPVELLRVLRSDRGDRI